LLLSPRVVLFFTYLYGDILITTSDGINLWDVLFKGNLLDFYRDNYHYFFGPNISYSANYDFPIYIIFGFWDFPLWVLKKFFNIITLNNIPALIWAKLIITAFFAGSLLTLYKIALQIKLSVNRAKWVVFTFATSALAFSSMYILNQYDIISVFFSLLGILMLMKKKTRMFVLFFAVAISMKLFAIFIFVPLLLLNEKKVWKLILNLLGGVSFLLIFKLIFLHAPMYSESTSPMSKFMFDRLWSNGIAANYYTASFFAIILVVCCIFCYIKTNLSEDLFNKYVIYIPLFIFSGFFSFIYFYPYWIVLLAPYLALVFYQNPKYLKINLLIDIIFSITFMVLSNLDFYWCYGPGSIDFLKIIPTIFGSVNPAQRKFPLAINFYNKFHITNTILPLLCGIFVACLASILFINFPRENAEPQEECAVERSVMWIRTLIILPFAIVPLMCYYWLK
jgi:hypothetical protein